jgi:hypothetical protein
MAHSRSLEFARSPAPTYAEPRADENPFAALLGAPLAAAPAAEPRVEANPFAALLAKPLAAHAVLPTPEQVEEIRREAPARRTRAKARTGRMICRCSLGARCGVPGQDGWGLRPE